MNYPRILYIDSLRGVAALGVAWFHIYTATSVDIFHADVNDNILSDLWGLLLNYVAVWGRFGVRLFFVISGFVLAFSLQQRNIITSLFSVGKYFLRRSIRLDPTYWAAIAITCLCLFFSKGPSYLYYHTSQVVSFKQLCTNMFYLNWILNDKAIFSVSWTLALEIQLYIAFAILLYVIHVTCKVTSINKEKKGKVEFIVISTVSLLSLLWPLGVFDIQTNYFFGYFHMFLTGVLIYNSLNDKRYLMALAVVDFILVLLFLKNHNSSVLAILISHILILSLQRIDALRTKAENKYLLYFGKLSYCIYVLHVPIGLSTATLALKFIPAQLAYGRIVHILIALTGLIVTILASELLYQIVERKSISLSKKIAVR